MVVAGLGSRRFCRCLIAFVHSRAFQLASEPNHCFPGARTNLPPHGQGMGAPVDRERKSRGQAPGKDIGGTGLHLLLSRNGRAESANPGATATEDLSFPPPSRTRRQLPRCLVTACSEGVSAKTKPFITTSSEISGPSSVSYVCQNITA